ncbi:hypothetical protein NF212_18995 [Parasalinivibrio latis]|uniref:hypothetical protein n=1 Tax=Parasalinivibrio latis TaxID=2952610 RepID=UPI0030E3A37B
MNLVAKLCVVLLFLFNVHAYAEDWEIASSLTVTPDSSMDVTYQALPELGFEEEIIAGWKGDELSYFLLSQDVVSGLERKMYWYALQRDYAKEGLDIKAMEDMGAFTAGESVDISIKKVVFNIEGDEAVQFVALLSSPKKVYWVIASSTDGDEDYLIKNFKELLQTVSIG